MSMGVLLKPFNVETHKKEFENYLEVVLKVDGEIVYAVPSHQEKLIKIVCEQQGITRDEVNDKCPREYYCDFMAWLCMESGCVAVWSEFSIGEPNKAQEETLGMLRNEGLYMGK